MCCVQTWFDSVQHGESVVGGQGCSSRCPRAERSLKADPSPAPGAETTLDGGQVRTTVMLPTKGILCPSNAPVFAGGSVMKESTYQCRRSGFDPWVGKIPWRRKWQPAPVCLPGESHGRRSLVGYSPWGRKTDTTQQLYNNALSTHHPHNPPTPRGQKASCPVYKCRAETRGGLTSPAQRY